MHVGAVKTSVGKDEFLATVLVDREYLEVEITSDCASL